MVVPSGVTTPPIVIVEELELSAVVPGPLVVASGVITPTGIVIVEVCWPRVVPTVVEVITVVDWVVEGTVVVWSGAEVAPVELRRASVTTPPAVVPRVEEGPGAIVEGTVGLGEAEELCSWAIVEPAVELCSF